VAGVSWYLRWPDGQDTDGRERRRDDRKVVTRCAEMVCRLSRSREQLRCGSAMGMGSGNVTDGTTRPGVRPSGYAAVAVAVLPIGRCS
jgi:hypothetical protein